MTVDPALNPEELLIKIKMSNRTTILTHWGDSASLTASLTAFHHSCHTFLGGIVYYYIGNCFFSPEVYNQFATGHACNTQQRILYDLHAIL